MAVNCDAEELMDERASRPALPWIRAAVAHGGAQVRTAVRDRLRHGTCWSSRYGRSAITSPLTLSPPR